MQDIITDIISDELEEDITEFKKVEVVPVRSEDGTLRDKATGKWLKGTAHKTKAKHHRLSKLLERKVGVDIERAIQKLVEIAMYDPDMPDIKYNRETGESSVGKRTFHFYNAATQLQALTLLLKYYYGNPRSEIQIDQTVDVKIEKKVADLTKLINDNQDRLHVVDGGKE